MVRKWPLFCCALCQLTCSDEDSIEEIQWNINKLKEDAKKWWNPYNRTSGERACFVITTPDEITLGDNLKKLGFKVVTKFNRRNGYEQNGLLKMWFLNW